MRPFKWMGAELEYIDLGSGTATPFSNTQSITEHADGSAWAAYAVGFLPVPLPVVEFYGKAGVARAKLNSSTTTTFLGTADTSTSSSSSTGTSFAWGIGVEAHISIAGLRLEYESFNMPDSSTAKVASLSVLVHS